MAKSRTRARSAYADTSPPPVEAAPAPDPETRDQRLYDAVMAYRAGRYAEAEAEAQDLAQAAPQFFPALLLRGMISAHTGRTAEAVDLLRAAVRLDRRSVEARNELAAALRAEGRYDDAIIEAKHAVRLQPDDPGSHNNLGLCCLAAGRVPLAITHFRRAIALKPDAAMFHHNLGLALERQSRDFEAIAAFRSALGLDAGHAESLGRLGRLLYQHGESDEAARCYERAAALHPDPMIAAINQAEGLIQQGQAVGAERCLRQALDANPQSDLGHQVLGVLLQRLGRFDEAAAALERAIELRPRRVSAYVSLALGKKIGAGDAALIDKMRNLLDAGELAAAERSLMHFALGKAYDDLGDYENAIGHFDKAHGIEAGQMREIGRAFDRRAHKAFVARALAGYTTNFFAIHRAEGSPSDLPVLIVGMPRSGTTLVEQILSRHRNIGGAGELSFWSDRLGLAAAAIDEKLPPEQLRRQAENYVAQLRLAAPAARRVTDKMPANFLALGLIHLALPEARIIHCRRHPLDTCLSIWATPFGNPLDFAHNRADLIFYYEQYARLMAHWRRLIPPDRLLEIDYEALVADPEPVTRAMIAFCGLDWDEACLAPERSEHLIMTPSVWQARQPVYQAAAGRWRRYEKWLGDFRRLGPVAAG